MLIFDDDESPSKLFEGAPQDASHYYMAMGRISQLMSRTDEPSKRKEIEEYFLKSKLKFIVLDPFQRRRRDSWKRLLEDNSILEDKNAFQEVVKRKMKVEKVKLSSFEEMLALH